MGDYQTEEIEHEKGKEKEKGKGKKKGQEQEPVAKALLHLVFDQQGAELIQESFSLEEQYRGPVLVFEEDYALGPVADIYEAEGWKARKQWWQSLLGVPEEEVPQHMVSDKMKLHDLKKSLEEAPALEIWIWLGQNPKDVCGYYWLISQLMDFQGRIQVLYLNNLPFINEKGQIFYPHRLGEILPREFVKAARLARTVTLSEFELDPDEWKKLCQEDGYVRTLDGGKKLISHPADFYDKAILDQLGSSAMKLPKLLGQLQTKARMEVPEVYTTWRIKVLIEAEQILAQGDWDKGIKNVVLKATAGQLFVDIESVQDDAEEDERQ